MFAFSSCVPRPDCQSLASPAFSSALHMVKPTAGFVVTVLFRVHGDLFRIRDRPGRRPLIADGGEEVSLV